MRARAAVDAEEAARAEAARLVAAAAAAGVPLPPRAVAAALGHHSRR
jgi:hypothetical protein